MGRPAGPRRPAAPTNPGVTETVVQQQAELAQLRQQAMELAASLDRVAKGAPEAADAALLKGGGVIDGLNTLTLIVTRVIDRERQGFAGAAADTTESQMNGRDIELRIIAEIDRLVAREREAGLPPGEVSGS